MPRINIYSLSMQISRMFDRGESMFCSIKVREWLQARNHNPDDYDIFFHEKPAPPESGLIALREIELRSKDGTPVDPELIEDINSYS
jgi:hypothetical protein